MITQGLSQEILKILGVRKQISIEELRLELRKTIVFLDFDFENILISLMRMGIIRVIPGDAKFRSAEEYNGNIIRNSGIIFNYIEKV
jgi:hypothetical protein